MRCSSRALPFLTVAMLAISAFVRSYGWAAVGVMVVMAFSLRLALKGERFREQFELFTVCGKRAIVIRSSCPGTFR